MSLSSTRRRGNTGLGVLSSQGVLSGGVLSGGVLLEGVYVYRRLSPNQRKPRRITANHGESLAGRAQEYAPHGDATVHFARQRTRLPLTPELRLSPSPPLPLSSSPLLSLSSPTPIISSFTPPEDIIIVICLLRQSVALPASLPPNKPPRVRPAAASSLRVPHSPPQMRAAMSGPPCFSSTRPRLVQCLVATRFG